MTARMTAIEEGSLKLADMVIARQKTFYMPIAPPVAVNETTEDEVIALNLPFTCEHCDRSFDSRAGLCTHTMLWCGEAGRQTWEEDFTVASIDGVRGPPDKRFFRVHWEGVNETGTIVRGGHAGDDTMPGEPWKPTWEPFRHLQSETAHIDLFWQLNPDLSPADDINVSTEHRCTDCNFFSVSERGLAIHKKSCRSKTRSIKGSRADRAVQRMKQQTAWANKDKVLCGDFELTNVYSFCYLGHLFQGDGDHSHDIETRLARASQAFGDLRTIFKHPDLGQDLKIELFRSAVCSVLTYGNEVWRLDDKTCRKLRGWASRCLVSFVKNDTPNDKEHPDDPDCFDRSYSQENRDPTFDLVGFLRAGRLRWVGHVIRLPEHRLLRKVMLRHVEGGRKPGSIMMDVPTGLSEAQLIDLAGTHGPDGHLEWDNLVRKLQGKTPRAATQHEKECSLPAGHMWSAGIAAVREVKKKVKKTEKRKREAAETAAALATLPTGARIIYTDGGCDGNGANGTWGAAGWGMCALEKMEEGGPEVRAEMWGPIVTEASDEYYCHCARGTNNTGELVGMAQALMWLRDVDGGDDAACICYDSEWAAKTTQGIFKARDKHVVECVDWCKSLLAAENERRKGGVCFVHVRGHSDDNGNDRADALVQWGKESGPYARGYEGGGEGESRLRGDGTEGAKAIEDQRKAKAAREAEKETESETSRSRGGLRQQPARPVFRSETDLQLDIGIAAVNVTAHNVVIQFDNTGTT
jgi:ribonuclease HI